MFTAVTLAGTRADGNKTRGPVRAKGNDATTKINPVVALETAGAEAIVAAGGESARMGRAPGGVVPLLVATSSP